MISFQVMLQRTGISETLFNCLCYIVHDSENSIDNFVRVQNSFFNTVIILIWRRVSSRW